MQEVYITKISKFLPNKVVLNDEIEDYLGKINGISSKARRIVLRSNKIKKRYYAIDKKGLATHTNSQLVAESIKKLFKENFIDEIKKVDLLTAGTSSPDQFMPSHAIMVHGEIPEMNSIEVMTASGNCCSGVQGMKYAFLNIATGQVNNAICTGSERLSRTMRAEQFEKEITTNLDEKTYLSFEKDFLRWMLSDGAASAYLSNEKNTDSISLKIDFIEYISYANKAETCMYMGGEKDETGNLISFKEFSPEEISTKSIFSIKQDVKLLSENILKFGMNKLIETLNKHKLNVSEFDYFLPHLSSYFFEDKIYELLKSHDLEISKEKWFTNLEYVGNVGAASPFLMLEELMNNKKIKVGEKILMMIPESARFSYVYISLTVV